MNQINQKNWFVVRTKAGDENRANTNLLHQEIETFLPLFKNNYYRNGKMIQTIKPLFPTISLQSSILIHIIPR
jgi:transcription antitermination factor NusG